MIGNHGQGGQQTGGSQGAGAGQSARGKGSRSRAQGGGRTQVAEPVVQEGDAQDQWKGPSPLCLHVPLAPLHRGLWKAAANGDVSKSTQEPVPTSYQLTTLLKTNGIFLAPNTFAGGQSPRERLDSSWQGRLGSQERNWGHCAF